jgi:hypothetical protein
MNVRIIRRASLLAVTAACAAAMPAQAHHTPTCPGYTDPTCNVNYFAAHQAQPHVDALVKMVEDGTRPVRDVVDGQVKYVEDFWYWCRNDIQHCVETQRDNVYGWYVAPVVAPVEAAVGEVRAKFDQVGCELFGAC